MGEDCQHCGTSIPDGDVRCPACLERVEARIRTMADQYYDRSSTVSDPAADTYRTRATFREKVELLVPRVEAVARAEETTTQSTLWGDGVDIWAMKHYLGAISAMEHWHGRPLLTSVVVNATDGYPGDGYFQLVAWLDGLPTDITTWPDAERVAWWEQELAAVHDLWAPE